MSLAIAISDSRVSGYYDYEPVSPVSEELSRKWAQERNYLKGSASDWFPIIDAAFQSIRNECKNANWDGEAALAINEQVIAIAEKLVEALFVQLTKGTSAPDVIPEADGEICISWTVDIERQFSISVGAHGKINFAGLFGKEGGIHGWQPIDATSPSALEKSLQDVTRHLEKLYPPPDSRRAA